jgi:hypothetical protein
LLAMLHFVDEALAPVQELRHVSYLARRHARIVVRSRRVGCNVQCYAMQWEGRGNSHRGGPRRSDSRSVKTSGVFAPFAFSFVRGTS